MGCRACGSAGGGCQFLGTAATAQVVPRRSGSPSPTPPWRRPARRPGSTSAAARPSPCCAWRPRAPRSRDLLTDDAVANAMLAHAAFGGSTNLLLHLAAIAAPPACAPRRSTTGPPRAARRRASSTRCPTARATTRRCSCTSPAACRRRCCTCGGWACSPRRPHRHRPHARRGPGLVGAEPSAGAGRERLREARRRPRRRHRAARHGPRARPAPTLVFPVGNLAPPRLRGQGDLDRPASTLDAARLPPARAGPRVRLRASKAMRAVKGHRSRRSAGDVLVLAGVGPMGTGMAEIASITIALKLLPWGREVAVLTDGRFSGVSTGPCIGHLSPEALAGGPIGRLRDGDLVELHVDRDAARGPRRPRRRSRAALHARGGRPRAGRPATSTPRWRRTRACPTTRASGRPCRRRAAASGAAALRRRRHRRPARGGARRAARRGPAARRERRAGHGRRQPASAAPCAPRWPPTAGISC